MKFSTQELSGALCGRRIVHFLPSGIPLALVLAGGLLVAGCASDSVTGPSAGAELQGATPIGSTGSSTKPIGSTGSSL
jgi:hypothetical protein